jgi:hypothetical protein
MRHGNEQRLGVKRKKPRDCLHVTQLAARLLTSSVQARPRSSRHYSNTHVTRVSAASCAQAGAAAHLQPARALATPAA